MGRTGRYMILGVLVLIYLPITYGVTIAHFPCLSYPTAYSTMEDLGQSIEAFRAKHGRLPNPSLPGDASAIRVDSGYKLDLWLNDHTYTLLASPEVDPDYKDSSILPFKMGFDGPWVVYDAKSKAVHCGHR